MKVTWSQKRKKKRCLATLPVFNEKEKDGQEDDEVRAPIPDLQEATQLAKEFQAQGDKLAVVCPSLIKHLFYEFFSFSNKLKIA